MEEKAKFKLEQLLQAYTTAHYERSNAVKDMQELRKQIELHKRIPLFIRKFFNAI